jgi:DNA repair exonuclease SbcCD ATPase subunit
MDRITNWVRANWNEETNVGKVKLGVIAVLIFIVLAALLPDAGRVPLGVPVDEIEAGAETAEAYRSYEARIAELERERQELQNRITEVGPIEQASAEAAAAYRAYEERISELEREKRDLTAQMARLEADGEVTQSAAAGDDGARVVKTTQPYGLRIAELERENRRLLEQIAERDRRIAALEQGADPQATTDNMELRLQLRALRANLDELLKRLGETEGE